MDLKTKTIKKITISLISSSCYFGLVGCSGWVPFTPYGNMPTQERYEFQAKLNANPQLKNSVNNSYGTYELVGPSGQPWMIKRPPVVEKQKRRGKK